MVSLLLRTALSHVSPGADEPITDRPNTGGVTPHVVLVFSSDPLSAALLGASIELAGYLPSFVLKDEAARSALLRVRPRLVVIDCDHEEACSEEFVGPALMTDARVLLFRSRRTGRDVTELATRLSLRVVDMPLEQVTLTATLNEMLGA